MLKYSLMSKRYVFGGCNTKMNVMCHDENRIYFCSNSNILISDSEQILDVIYLENYLNFVKVENNSLIAGDIKGNFYHIKKKEIIKHTFHGCLQNGCFVTDSVFALMFLKEIIIFDVHSKIVLKEWKHDNLISVFLYYNDVFFVAATDGNIKVYDKHYNLVTSVDAHNDRIQDMKHTILNGVMYIATSSKDCTVKIWKYVDEKVVHVQTLVGHNDWVFNIHWSKNGMLISASADKTAVEWYHDGSAWVSNRIMGGCKAFYNAFVFCKELYGQSHTGGIYKLDTKLVDFLSGHTDEVVSLDWNGEFLLSASYDATVRIYVQSREVCRPLTHGYPISTAKFLHKDNLAVAVGAHETIIRILQPTYLFYECYKYIKSKIEATLSDRMDDMCINESEPFFQNICDYELAAIPAELSLTNDVIEDYEFENLNEHVLSTTSMSETKKMYGHYFEISDIAVSSKYIVSCNKSNTRKFSGIFLWNRNYDIIDYLEVHAYGIIKLRISPNEKYLCAVSKDKTSSLYEVDDKLKLLYRNHDHKRVVWDCSFSYDTAYYTTCSRDKNTLIYDTATNELKWRIEFPCEVTSIDFSPKEYELVVGLETGVIAFIIYSNNNFIHDKSRDIIAHSQRVNVVRFNEYGSRIATGGKDGLINVFKCYSVSRYHPNILLDEYKQLFLCQNHFRLLVLSLFIS